MIRLLLINFTLIAIRIQGKMEMDECYYGWSTRGKPDLCSASSDCMDAEAECVFSVMTGTHICCKPKQGAVIPKCPRGRRVFVMGKITQVICDPANKDGNDACPEGSECLESVTNFTKNAMEPNFVCCKI